MSDERGANVRESVKDFSILMEIVLRGNDDKGGWDSEEREYLESRLSEELEELKEAKTYEEIKKEAADVANFAMMIADNAKRYSEECDYER
jgi:NTP pyrophosphatase (non-canonical NTP hydrolase)